MTTSQPRHRSQLVKRHRNYSYAPPSPQSSNLRVGPQLPFHIVTAGPEDDASGAAGLQLGETFAQLLASACEGHLFGGRYINESVMAVRNVEVMTAVNGEVTSVFVHPFDAGQPRFAVRQRLHASRIGRVPVVIGERDERFESGRARGEMTSSPSSRTVPLVDTRQVSNPSAGPPREIRPSAISLASARALGPWPAM